MITARCCRALLIVLAALPLGCRGSGDLELVEARLRDQQDLASRYQRMLAESQTELRIARGETNQLRQQLVNAGQSPILPEHADVLLRAESIAFDSMMSGGRDTDGQPGDDLLHVILTPKDHDGETVKLIGELQITAESGGSARPIGQWTFSPSDARNLWHAGFLSSGYQLELPWQETPIGEEVVVHAKLNTADGRELTATHLLKVEPPPYSHGQRMLPRGEPNLLPGLSDGAEPSGTARVQNTVPADQSRMASHTTSGFLNSLDSLDVPKMPSIPSIHRPRRTPQSEVRHASSKPRPVPEPVDIPGSVQPGTIRPIKREAPAQGKDQSDAARPFPSNEVVEESTNWKVEMIPVVR